jgi:integrase
MATRRKRRSPGEGSVWEYREKNGTVRYAIGHPSFGTRRRGPHGEKWFTRRDAQAALRTMLTDTERGELTDPSKQPLGAYLGTWLDGHPDIGDSTRASYAKNIRLHVVPYLGTVPLASLTSAKVAGLYRTLLTSGRKDYRAGEGLSAGTRGQITEGPTKTGKARVVDLDPATVDMLRAHKGARGSLHLALAAADALVFADEQGTHLHPERFSRTFVSAVKRCAAAGHDVPVIRAHDLRH